jgi:hypothetical protein
MLGTRSLLLLPHIPGLCPSPGPISGPTSIATVPTPRTKRPNTHTTNNLHTSPNNHHYN